MTAMYRKKLALILLVVVLVGLFTGISVIFSFFSVKDVSLEEVVSNPRSFDGSRVRLYGYMVNTSVYMFGPKYVLRDFEEDVEIALDVKGDFESYVSFVFDGRNYTQIRNIKASVVGYIHYLGTVLDAPSFNLEVEKIEPRIDDLKRIVTDFLNTTDVALCGLYGDVEIKEVYTHKLGGKIIVVDYTTRNAVHPHFMCEALERHTAVITLNEEGQVVSAFCVWGSFHGLDRIWDLINQRWIEK